MTSGDKTEAAKRVVNRLVAALRGTVGHEADHGVQYAALLALTTAYEVKLSLEGASDVPLRN